MARQHLALLEELTPRQKEVLLLIQQGKVNKEIANQLNISLGTVKQHLVAIFKKLQVNNRTMAVSRLAELETQTNLRAAFAQETLIARRPAIVLSIKLADGLPQAVFKLFHTALSEIAFDTQAQFISRQAGDGDLIFGLKRSSTQDIRMAIRVAEEFFYKIHTFVSEQIQLEKPKITFSDTNQLLTGVLVAGLITVSQNRFGGWSGETVGSELLTQAHQLRDKTPSGYLYFHPQVLATMQAFGLTLPPDSSSQLLFSQLSQLKVWDLAKDKPLIGRDDEIKVVEQLLNKEFSIFLIESENGMGKSRLAREAARLAVKQARQVIYINVLPSGDLDSEIFQRLEKLATVINLINATIQNENNYLLVLDDAHYLLAEDKQLLIHFLNYLPANYQVIISGRYPQHYSVKKNVKANIRLVHLNRLKQKSALSLVSHLSTSQQPEILATTRGIPLFINELAKQKADKAEDEYLSLALIITIASRIDKFKIDWKLLYCIALYNNPVSLLDIEQTIQDDLIYIQSAIKRAEELGVLIYQNAMVSFKSPLVKKVIHYLFQSKVAVN